jgi:hypothetical protein
MRSGTTILFSIKSNIENLRNFNNISKYWFVNQRIYFLPF